MDLLIETLERLRILHHDHGIPRAKLSRAGLMPKWTAVIGTEGQCGITLNFTEQQHVFGEPRLDINELRSFVGTDLFTVAEHYLKLDSLQERSIAASAVSALSQPLLTGPALENRGFRLCDREQDFSRLLVPEDIAVMIGYGGSALSRVPGKCREFHVCDIRPRKEFNTLIVDTDIRFVPDNIAIHTDRENPEVLGKATAVLITGSTLVNGTLESLLGYTQNARVVQVWGPSASVIPDVLFERGVNYLETYRVSDSAAFESDVLNNLWDLKTVFPKTQTALIIARREE